MKNIITGFIFLVMLANGRLVPAETIGRLPDAVSNNAVAAAMTSRGWELYSFNGLGKNKNWQAVSNKTYGFNLSDSVGFVIDSVPYVEGRLASIAVSIKNNIFLFGGYTVAQDHAEKSMSDVYQFDGETRTFSLFSQMPIPVDDTVALVYRDRYIYLISGWHDVGNIADVQVLDTETRKWFFATPYPGAPAFGHAAGIVNNSLVVVDGVKVSAVKNGKRQFQLANQSFIGEIDPQDFTRINWQKLSAHPGRGSYRMAATGVASQGKIYFSGGSNNPYNYDGIGYDGVASEPLQQMFAYDLSTHQWQQFKKKSLATMDHRGLINLDNELYTIGGMTVKQLVTDQIIRLDFQLVEDSMPANR